MHERGSVYGTREIPVVEVRVSNRLLVTARPVDSGMAEKPVIPKKPGIPRSPFLCGVGTFSWQFDDISIPRCPPGRVERYRDDAHDHEETAESRRQAHACRGVLSAGFITISPDSSSSVRAYRDRTWRATAGLRLSRWRCRRA